jgi:hypothetical protein
MLERLCVGRGAYRAALLGRIDMIK